MASSRELATYDAWKEHMSRKRIDTELSTHHLLQSIHPDQHITRTVASKCDLPGFAAAGHAKQEADLEAGYNASRLYTPTRGSARLDKGAGSLEDTVHFARWRYGWEGRSFVVYEVSYQDKYLRTVRLLYVLAPPGDGKIVDGHHADTDALLLAVGAWTKELHKEIYVFDDSTWTKSKDMFRSMQGSSWDDVILPPVLKANLKQDVLSFFDNRELYASMRVPWKRGIILHGVPGNGKTISIKALINSLAARDPPVPSLVVKSFDACSGPKWAMQAMFAHARKMAPCLLIFEDLDSLVEDKTRSYFLNEVDGLETNDGILMVGSTNHLGRLDPAITKRPSRFDRKYHFRVPAEPERVAYCRYWADKFAGRPDVDFSDEAFALIAKATHGFSYAYLKELFITSLLVLVQGKQDEDDEVQGANEKEEAADAVSSESSSTSGVVVESPGSMDEKAEEKSDEDTDADKKDKKKKKKNSKKEKKKPAKPREPFPVVEIPESLQGNELLKIVLGEAKKLWEQMDNSEDETRNSCGPGAPRYPWQYGLEEDD